MLSLLQIPIYLGSIMLTLIPISLPFCAIQLALCKFCPWRPVQFTPLALSGAGLLWSWLYLDQHSNWDALLGILVLFSSLLCLTGSGLGWLGWHFSQKRLN